MLFQDLSQQLSVALLCAEQSQPSDSICGFFTGCPSIFVSRLNQGPSRPWAGGRYLYQVLSKQGDGGLVPPAWQRSVCSSGQAQAHNGTARVPDGDEERAC